MTSEDFFQRVETQYKNTLPFVAYRKPNSTKVAALLQNNNDLYITENFTESGFVFSPFDDKEATVLMPLKHCEKFEFSLDTAFPANSDNHLAEIPLNYKSDYSESKKQHINLINKGIEVIKKQQLKKVVLSRKETIHISETNPTPIFKRLLNAYPLAFVYCWYHPKVGMWFGATPETLMKIDGTRFSMMALAGTQEYKGNLEVIWKDKEKMEQQLVTDFIIEKLKPSVENIRISETQTVKAGSLLHLRTMITAQLKPEISNLKKIIFDLHPTPAVCGLPKLEAKIFILDHENYPREFYTGFIGELQMETNIAPKSSKRNIENRAYSMSKKCTQLYVNLRCMKLYKNTATLFVGGGITETSNPEAEWEETVSKSMIIKSILQ